MKSNNTPDAMSKLKQICRDSEKFEKKIIGKQFLAGKYFDAQKTRPIAKKQKKFTKSKIQNLLNIQQKIVGKHNSYLFYQPLHKLWTQYIADLIKNDNHEDSVNLKLLRADFHGALIRVMHSKIDSYIGLEGIIVNQTLKTFKIITRQNKVLTLLKNQIIFQVEVANKNFIINGNCLVIRSVDRSKQKFKAKKAERINIQFIGKLIEEQISE